MLVNVRALNIHSIYIKYWAAFVKNLQYLVNRTTPCDCYGVELSVWFVSWTWLILNVTAQQPNKWVLCARHFLLSFWVWKSFHLWKTKHYIRYTADDILHCAQMSATYHDRLLHLISKQSLIVNTVESKWEILRSFHCICEYRTNRCEWNVLNAAVGLVSETASGLVEDEIYH